MKLTNEDNFRIEYCLGKSIQGLKTYPTDKPVRKKIFVNEAQDKIFKICKDTNLDDFEPNNFYVEDLLHLILIDIKV